MSENHTASQKKSNSLPLRLGISRCLLGDSVRYDGGHKHNSFLVDVLGQQVEWVPVCPEVEAGFGTPREPMRLVEDLEAPHLLTIQSQQDHTSQMTQYTKKRIRELQSLNLAGYVFKKDSPSCGIRQVRVFTREGHLLGKGSGIFAKAFQKRFPLTPIEEEGRLQDPGLRENFIERVFAFHRWQLLTFKARLSPRALIEFHTIHKYLLLAHSRSHYQKLGHIVAQVNGSSLQQVFDSYAQLFMEGLTVKATVRKHLNVLEHLAGHLKNVVNAKARAEIHEVLHDYHHGLVPLSVPVTLIRHYVRLLEIPYLGDQVYLSPHPKELMLRNHV